MQFTLSMPKLSPTMEEGVIAKWHKKEGDLVKGGEVLLEITTDKATLEHTALDEGWLRKILVQEGDTVSVNQPIAIFTEEKEAPLTALEEKKEEAPSPQLQTKKEAPPPQKKEEREPAHIKASPLAKKLAQEKGIDLTSIQGTGPGGRITSEDLAAYQPSGGTIEEIPLTPMRKAIAKKLQEAKSTIPHYYVKTTIDASSLIDCRDQLKHLGTEVTFNDLILKGVALALKTHPEINSGFNPDRQAILRFKTIDISIAVTVQGGLITPILKDADHKTLKTIHEESRHLIERARQNKLKEEEYRGGSFTISNLGMYGISDFIAVINPPQAAILAIGAILDAPVIKESQVVPGKTLNLVLSADHRVIDGAEAAQFLKTVKYLLENSLSLLLNAPSS